MSEPTPLSAEQRERLESIHPMWSHQSGVRGHLPGEGCDVFPCLTNRALATIDAQATEIAALKGALAAVIPWIDGEPRDRAYRMALLRYNDSAGGGTETDVLNELERQRQVVFRAARVLAGKEAQR